MLIGTDTAPVRLAGGDLEIRFFGHADIRSAGVSLKFAKRSTTLAMLALIVLQRGRAISRESLAFTLFPEVDEAAALAELRRLLYTTSKSLPDTPDQPVVVVDAETVRFNPASAALPSRARARRMSSTSTRTLGRHSGRRATTSCPSRGPATARRSSSEAKASSGTTQRRFVR